MKNKPNISPEKKEKKILESNAQDKTKSDTLKKEAKKQDVTSNKKDISENKTQSINESVQNGNQDLQRQFNTGYPQSLQVQ